MCGTCRIEKYLNERDPYRKFKGDKCEKCGFVGHKCQLDVDHIDGDHYNNELSNLQTLCANCHRLKTYENRDQTNRRKVV